MLKLERPKLQKQQTDFVNASKLIIERILYKDNNIPQSLKHYLDRAKIEDANQVTEEITKYSPIQTPPIINPETSQLEHQEYKPEDLEKHIHALDNLTHLALLKRNRRSDSSDEDNQQLKNFKLFEAIRKQQSEKTIIEEIKRCLDDGAEINARNTRGKAVLHIAVEKNYKDVVEFLLKQQGININTPDKDGKTALNLAEDINNQDIIDLLKSYVVPTSSIQFQVIDSNQAKLDLVQDPSYGLKNFTARNINIEHVNRIKRSDTDEAGPSSAKKRKMDKKAEGVERGGPGLDYQIQLSMYFARQGYELNKQQPDYSFELGKERMEAGKFDDIIIRYKQNINAKWDYLLLQSKYTQDKITTGKLLSSDNTASFTLIKYFSSYIKSKEDYKKETESNGIESCVIVTNSNFQYDKNTDNKLKPANAERGKAGTGRRGQNFYLEPAPLPNEILKVQGASQAKYLKFHSKYQDKIVAELKEAFTENYNKTKNDKKSMRKDVNKEIIKNLRDIINDDQKFIGELNDFVDKLLFIVNLPDRKEIRDIIKDNIGEEFLLLNDIIVDQFNRDMFDYTINKDRKKFLSGEDIKKLFNKMKQTINTLQSKPNYYLKIQDSVIDFKPEIKEKIDCNNFLSSPESNNKNIFLLKTDSIFLTAVKMYKILQDSSLNQYKYNDKHTFLSLQELKSTTLKTNVMNSFRDEHGLNLLVIVFDDLHNPKTQDLPRELCENINNNKRIIFITPKDFKLDNSLNDKQFNANKNTDEDNNINFKDLTDPSKKLLLDKTIMFQGEDISLKQLYFKSEGNEQLSSEQLDRVNINIRELEHLATTDNIEIKRPISIGDLEAAYSKCYEEINHNVLVENLLNQSDDTFFMISGIGGENKKDILTSKLKSNSDIIQQINGQIGELQQGDVNIKRISIADSQFGEKDFKKLCHSNADKKIYWINWKDNKFVLQQLYYSKFYLGRRFDDPSKVVIERGIKKELEEESNDIFIFSETNKKDFHKLFEDSLSDGQKNYVCFEKDSEAEDKLRTLELDNKSIHWLKIENEQLIWQKSRGSLDILCQYRNKEKSLTEEQLVKQLRNKVKALIIIDEPGMGKSTSLVSLSQQMLKSHWVIHLMLKDCSEAINNISDDITVDHVVEFLSNTKILNTPLEKNLVRFQLEHKTDAKPLLLLFDGFDEIKDRSNSVVTNKQKVGKLLTFLKDKATILVTARQNEKKILQESLSVFDIGIKAFKTDRNNKEKSEVEEYLEQFWKNHIKFSFEQKRLQEVFANDDNAKFQIYSEALIKEIKNLSDKDTHFIGVPLTLRLMAEVYKDEFKDFISNPEDQNSFNFDNFSIYELFTKFIDKKYDIYFKEKTKLYESLPSTKSRELFIEPFTKRHQRLAFRKIFDEEQAKELLEIKLPFVSENNKLITLDDEELTEMYSIGLIKPIGEKGYKFIHDTFAEYFVGELLVKWLKRPTKHHKNQEVQKFLLNEILLKGDYKIIRYFFNQQLMQDIPPLKMNEEWRLSSNNEIRLQTTVLHVAVEENNEKIVDLLVRSIEETNDLMFKLLATRNNKHETVLYIAAKKKNSDLIKKFLGIVNEHSADVQEKILLATIFRKKQDEMYQKKKDKRDANIEFFNEQLEKFSSLNKLKESLNLNNKDTYDQVGKFLSSTTQQEIEEILSSLPNENVRGYLWKTVTKKGNNILHKAARANSHDLVQWLVNAKKILNFIGIDDRDYKQRTALHKAARAGAQEIVELLMDKGADINAKDNWGNIPLRDAVRFGEKDLIQFFLDKYDKTYYINSKDKNDKTILDEAVIFGHLEIVKWLVEEKNADVTSYTQKLAKQMITQQQDPYIHNLLADDQRASRETYEEILEFLEKSYNNTPNENPQDRNTISDEQKISKEQEKEALDPLISSASSSGCNSGASGIHSRKKRAIWSCTEQEEESGKQQVVKVGKWHEVVRWLIEEKGADINAKDEFGRTILHKAAEFGRLDLVKWLLEERGADVNTLEKYDTSLLHFATASGNLALVKWLIEDKHVAINVQDKFGKSPLHFASLYSYQDIVALLVAKNADINLRDRNGETALDLARKEQHQEMIKQLQKASIELENKQYIEISLDNLTELRKEQKEIGLKPSGSASTFGCNTQYRTKRHIGSCQEEESNNVSYEPLEESVPVEQVRASKIYSQISMAVILKNADQFSSGNSALDHILIYNKYIGEIIAEQKANNSPREQRILASHYQQAQQFLKDYPETKLLKKIARNSDEVVNIDDNQSWLFDNGQQSMLVFQEGNHYGLYSQDFNYRQKFQTKENLTFEQLEGFIKAFFKWHSGSSKYQTFTLADTLPAKLIKQLKLAKFWHAEQVAPDNILLHEQHLGLIESISALVIRKLFLLHGQSPDIAGLHADFFAHNKNNISLRFEMLHKVLPSLNAEQIQGLMAVIKKYNIAIDRTYLDTLSGDEKSLLELYYNKVTNKLKTDVAITPQLLSELSWESLSDGVANHPDISHELASKIVNSNKQVHEAASKGAVLKGMATQGLFFLPDIIRAANSGDISNLEQTGAMIAGDAAINHLYGALVSKLATIIPAGQAELLGKLPVTSPIFKALTIYSIVELHKQLASLPANSEERSIIKHKLGEQYFTAGLMVAELLGFEVTPLWIGLIAEQLIFDATSFRKQNHLDIPFWEALAMSLGFEQDKLQNILEERQLVEMNLELVNQINNQTQIPYGLTIVKIPKLGKLKWQNITQDQVPDDIRYKIDNIQDFSPVISPYQILEENGFRRVDKYELNAYQAYSETFLNRGKLISSIWQKASYDAYPQKSKLAFALHHNNMNSFKHEDNIFLDQLSVNNVTYQRIPSKATGIFLNGQDVLKRSEAEAAAVYLNTKAYHHANAQSNFYVGFDPREGDIELEFTSQGLERIDTMNVMRYFATKNIAMHNSLNNTSPYMITVQLANKPYPDSLEFAKDKGAFSVRDNSQRIISQYVINDDIDYVIKDFTSATRISFMSNLEQQTICNTIRSEPNTIFILKWQCNNKMVNGKNQIEYLNLTDISGRILISDNKKYLQLILNNHVIDSHLRVSAEHIDIIEAKGRLDKNSKIDIMQAVNSFNVTLRGDIIVSDQATYLQMQGEVAGILPAIIYAKSAHNKVISLYEFNIDNLQAILETMLRSNDSEFMDIKFSSNDVQYHWHNKLPINNTLQLAGRLDGKRALLQIELKSNSLRVFNDDNSIATTQIAHYDTNAILENGLILQKVFRTIEPNVTVTSNSELLTSTDSGNMLEFNIAGYYGQADVLEFQAPAGYFIYHYFPINRIIKLNNINYIVKNQMICASSAGQTIINGYELIKYGTISNLGNIEQMVGICFPHLLAESKIFVKNDTLCINDLTLKSLEDSTKLYFNETEILSVKTLKDSLAKNQISNVTASNTKHIGKQNIAEHAGQEYLVNLHNSSRTINYNQLNKATIILNNIKTGELKVTANNNDLLFVASSSNHTLRIKNWPSNEVNNSDNRIVTLKFDQLLPAIEIRAINKLKLSEIAKIQNLVSKAELSYAITNKLEQLDAKMINDLKYLLVSSHKVGLTGNNHCLGLKSSAEQQEFISSYGQHYSQEQLQKILNHDQIIKALTWLIAKDYNDLSLQEPSKEKTELITAINKCYKEVISGKIIHRLLKHLEEGHAIAKIERFIEHHEQELKQKITAEFKASKVASSSFITESITEILDSEIPQHVRGRRAIDVQNEHDDEVENINDTIITSTATSMQSPMNNMINWLKTNIVGALLSNVLNPVNKINWFTAENVKSSSIGAKQTADSSTNNTDKNSTSIKSVDYAQFNLNDSLTLADLIIREITKVKPYITKEAPLNLLEAQAQVLNIIAGFEEILEEYAKEKDILMAELKFDPITLQKQLISEIVNGSYSNIAKILSASLEKTQAIKDTKLKHYLQDKITAILEKQQDMLLANEPLIDNRQNNQFSNQPKIENINIVYNIADVENYGNITTNCQPDIGLIG